MKHLTFN